MTRTRHLAKAVFLTTLIAMPMTAAVAGEMPGRWKRAELSVGAYLATFGSDFRADSDDLGAGTSIDLERQLDLDDEIAAWRADGYWRFFNRHRLELGYYDLSRDGERTLDEQIQFGDEVFDAGVNVESDFDFRVGKVAYAYSLIQNDQWDAALSLGVTAIQLRAAIEGEVFVGNQSLNAGTETKKTIAPIPVLGGRVWYAFADNWTARLKGDIFKLDIGKYEGSLYDAELALDYDLTDAFGVTLGYNYVNIDVDKTGGSYDLSVGYDYSAIILAGRIFLN